MVGRGGSFPAYFARRHERNLTMTDYLFDHLETPLGELGMITDGNGKLCLLEFLDQEDRWKSARRRRFSDIEPKKGKDAFGHLKKLRAYFDGDIGAIKTIPVDGDGTEFQKSVWRVLRTIPAGKTLSYGAVANKIGNPNAVRAVGLANGANPIGIVVPCHRVIGANGSLTGYGGGLHRKTWLLEHEAKFTNGCSRTRATHCRP